VKEPRVAGVLLAAGAGTRFGSVKQLAEFDGRPLLQHAVDAALGVPVLDPVVVVLGAEAAAVSERVELGPAEVVICDDWGEGMAASLRAGVAAAGDPDWVVVTLGDQPLITAQAIAMVVDYAVSAGPRLDAVRATYGGEPGHPVALGRRLLRLVPELVGDHGARELLDSAKVRHVEALHLCRPDDVDTPQQLATLGR
jgi:CTP:molybdopterin cytidylyltransferase MocA